MAYTKPYFSWYQNSALTRNDGNHKDVMLSQNKRSHDNNCIE